MALQALKSRIWIPSRPVLTSAGLGLGGGLSMTLSAGKIAVVGAAPKTGTLDKFEFRLGTVTQAPSNGLRCSFQDVDATTGAPDGTQDQYRDITSGLTSNSWQAPGLMTSDGTDGGSKRSVTAGDEFACVIEFVSFVASDSLQIAESDLNTVNVALNYPYRAVFTSAWALNAATPVIVLKYNDGTYEVLDEWFTPHSAAASSTLNTGTTPDEAGNIFQVPFACKVDSFWVRADFDGDTDVILYDSDGTTPLATHSVDKDKRGGTGGNTYMGKFPSAPTLAINTNYRIAVKPTSATSMTLARYDVNAAAILDAVPGGQLMHWTQRTDAGSWSQTTTRRALIGLGISSLDDGAGGSADYPAVTDVRLGVTFNTGGSTGTLAVPAAADVQTGVQFGAGGTQYTGTFSAPSAGDVRSGTTYGAAAEFTGTLAVPATNKVLTPTAVDATTGTLTLPTAAQVLNAVSFGVGGTGSTGTYVAVAVGNVRDGTTFGASSALTGTLELPAEADVAEAVGYGTDGTEFTGTLTGGGGGLSLAQLQGELDGRGLTLAWSAAVPANVIEVLGAPAEAATDPPTAAENATAVLTTQMTEAYAANAAAPTLAQAQFAIHQMLMDFVISGTSLTVQKLDGTTAFVVTLNSATTPTGATRA